MEICDECGLPKKACAALIEYRKALNAYEDGRLTEAHERADAANTLISEFRTQRAPMQSIELSDDERLRLSRFF